MSNLPSGFEIINIGIRKSARLRARFYLCEGGSYGELSSRCRRCKHVKTNGTQCRSPALKGKELCFYHEKNRPAPASFT